MPGSDEMMRRVSDDDVGIILLRDDRYPIEHFSVQEMYLIELDRSITHRLFHSKAPSLQIQIDHAEVQSSFVLGAAGRS